MAIQYLPIQQNIIKNVKLQKPSKEFNPLQAIYTTLVKNQQLKDFNATIIAINIDTILRAIIQKQNIQNVINIRLILPDIQNELLQIIDSSIEYFETQMVSNQLINDYFLVIYKVDYSFIPEEYQRNTKFNMLISSFSDMITSDISVIDDIETTINSRTHYLKPNIHIIQSINTYGITTKFNNILVSKILKPNHLEFDAKIIFISHYPVDYHINNIIKYVVVDSYTGNIWDRNTLPIKLFKQDYLVFNKVTHAIFGDKHILKPIIIYRYRRKLVNAIQASGKIWDNDNILNYLSQICPMKYISNLLQVVNILS